MTHINKQRNQESVKNTKSKKNTSLALKLTALAGASGIAPAVHASIVESTTTPILSLNRLTWDVDGVHPVFALNQVRTHTVSGFINQTSASLNPVFGARVVASQNSVIANLAVGDNVGPTLGTARNSGRWLSANQQIVTQNYGDNGRPVKLGSNYIGFSFINGSTTDYGWAVLVLHGQDGTTNAFTIQDAYYDNTGAAIRVGATVPEPSSIALLALGATGLAAWRQRKKTAETKTA